MYFRTQLLILYQNHSVCPFLGKFLSKVPLYFFITSHLLAKKKTTNNQLTGWSGRTFHLIWSDKRVFIVYDNPIQTLYLIMQHLCESTSCQLFHPQHSRCTICVSFQYWLFLHIHPQECRTDHYICVLGVCMEYHSPFLPQNIQILTTVSCSRFILRRHWQLRRLFLFVWQFDPCVWHPVLPPQEAQCVGNAKIKEQSRIEHLSELCTVELDWKWPCPLESFNYFIDTNSSKWCCCFRVLKKSRLLTCIMWLRGFRNKRA